MSGFEVDLGQLGTHASDVGALSQKIAEASAAGATVTQDLTAFGLLCQFVVPFVATAETGALNALSSLERALSCVETGLGTIKDAYQAADEEADKVFTSLLEAMS